MKRFWTVYLLAVAAYVFVGLGSMLGPWIEARFWPIRIEQTIEVVERGDQRLCWIWHSTKVRVAASDDIDVHLIVRGDRANRYTIAVYRREDRMPWSRNGALGVGRHHLPFCATLPPRVTDADDLLIEQVAWFPGWLGLWRTPLVIPDVVSPGARP